jgi:hypothetical protein
MSTPVAQIPAQASPPPAPAPAAPAAPPPTPTVTYKIGDKGPAGGIIFYVSTAGFTLTTDGTTCHYLEAAPADLGSVAWASSDAKSTNIAGLAVAVGAGKKNTNLIIAADPNAPAANACRDYSGGGKSDWFLPSMSELTQLYNNRDIVGGFFVSTWDNPDAWYWSSSQDTKEKALFLLFNSKGSSQGNLPKTYAKRVRPIRAF